MCSNYQNDLCSSTTLEVLIAPVRDELAPAIRTSDRRVGADLRKDGVPYGRECRLRGRPGALISPEVLQECQGHNDQDGVMAQPRPARPVTLKLQKRC